jgi:hypothetical protein
MMNGDSSDGVRRISEAPRDDESGDAAGAMAPARGILLAVALSLPIWGAIGLAVWRLAFRP